MRKKIFTFLLALAASVGMSWASVTWISDEYGNHEEKGYYAGTPFTKDGVTVTMSDDAFFIVSYWGDASLQCVKGTFGPTAGNYVFSNSLGENFVKIVIAAGYPSDWEWFPKGDGWVLSGDEDNGYTLTWTGNASTVTLMDNGLHSVNQSIEGDIVFYFESDSEEPQLAVANTLQLHVNDALMGSLALQDPSNDIFDFGDGTYGVPEGATVTLIATPNEGYEFIGWKASSTICDFNECEFVALPTKNNPLTFDMYNEAAFMAEFAAVASQPATTVTWNSSNISNLTVNGSSYSKEGITLGPNANNNYAYWLDYGSESQNGIYFYVNATGGHTFSNSLGKNFTKIEMTLNGSTGWYVAYLGSGWNIDGMKVIWTGNASTVDLLTETSSFGGAAGVKSIVFYFEGDSEEPGGGSTPTTWTSLKVGDVIKVGDKIEVPAEGDGSWGINGNVLRNTWGPYTLILADIYQASEFDDPVVTETEDGAFYVFKAENSDFYPLSNLGKGTGLVVTATSDGLVVTAAENKEFTVAVHENGSDPTAVENVQTNEVQASKLMENGVLYILHNGTMYNVQGARVKEIIAGRLIVSQEAVHAHREPSLFLCVYMAARV